MSGKLLPEWLFQKWKEPLYAIKDKTNTAELWFYGKEIMMDKDHVHHKHPLPKKDLSRDCTKCKHAKKVADHEWECDAKLYDIRMLTCFEPREED